MKYRICAWTSAGFLVASFWAFYLFPTATNSTSLLTLARFTCPIAFVDVPLRFYWVVLANAATYALVGGLVEAVRHPKATAQP
jgi:hypothetical protein